MLNLSRKVLNFSKEKDDKHLNIILFTFYMMAFESAGINYLAVLIGALASFVFGWLWYGPLFGKIWAKEMKFSKKDGQAAKKSMGRMLFVNFIGTLVTVFVVANLLAFTDVVSIAQGLQLMFWVWLGFFAAATLLGQATWGGHSATLYVINAAYWLINLLIVAAIVVAIWI